MLLIRNGKATISQLIPSTGKYQDVLTEVWAHLSQKSDGALQDVQPVDPGLEQQRFSTVYTLTIGGRDENPGPYVPRATDMIKFRGQEGDENLDGEYIQLSDPVPSGGIVKHIRYTVIRSTESADD